MVSRLFRGKKSPSDLVKSATSALSALSLEEKSDGPTKSQEKMSQHMAAMKSILYGDSDSPPVQEKVDQLCTLLLQAQDEEKSEPLLVSLVMHIERLEFEARKDVAQIYTFVLRNKADAAKSVIQNHPAVLHKLVHGYDNKEIALNCGSILRECIRYPELASTVLQTQDLFYPFFDYVQMTTFDVASDAFATFKSLLTKHKKIAAKFLEENFDTVFENVRKLLESKNYVTKRQTLKLLGELLLDRSNFKVMMRYINSPAYLKLIMGLFRKTTKTIQYEAFHVFKIFVANPQKSKEVASILYLNKERLVEFLQKFRSEKESEDQQFSEEKRILITSLEALEKPEDTKSDEKEG